MKPATTLSEHIQNEQLERLDRAWQYLTPWQRKVIQFRVAVGSLGPRLLHALDAHIQRRQVQFVYLYPAHWLTTASPKLSRSLRSFGDVVGQGGG